jgi:hypothetical protein
VLTSEGVSRSVLTRRPQGAVLIDFWVDIWGRLERR